MDVPSRTSAPTPALDQTSTGLQIILGKVRPSTSPGRGPSTGSDHCSSHDDGESSTGEIAHRLHETAHYASVYRSRLIDAGVIEPTRRGYVDFAIPYLREYLREHAARYEMAKRHHEDQPPRT